MQTLEDFWTQARQMLPFVGVAVMGAVIRSLRGEWPGWRNFAASVLTAGFGAFVIGLAADDLGLSSGWAFFLSGMIGYSGGRLVDECLKVTTARLGEAAGKEER